MTRILLWLACLGVLTAFDVQAGPMDTIRITITGGDLAAPIVISDPAITSVFKVWAGPGNFRRVAGSDIAAPFPQGFIVDWSRGIVEAPKGLISYEVAFLTTRSSRNTYLVKYVIDPSSNRGFVYSRRRRSCICRQRVDDSSRR